jgi:hypothetical protein
MLGGLFGRRLFSWVWRDSSDALIAQHGHGISSL